MDVTSKKLKKERNTSNQESAGANMGHPILVDRSEQKFRTKEFELVRSRLSCTQLGPDLFLSLSYELSLVLELILPLDLSLD